MISDNRKIYGRFIEQPIYAEKLFADLPLETRKKLLAIQKSENIKEGETISKIGSFPEFIYVLTEGKAQISYNNELNHKNISRLIEKEEFIGLTQLISGLPNEITITALTPCSLNVFQTQDFLYFLKNEPQVCFSLFAQLSLDIESSYQIFSSMYF